MKKSLNFMYKEKYYFRQNRSKLAYEFSLKNYNIRIKKEYELIFEKINHLSKIKSKLIDKSKTMFYVNTYTLPYCSAMHKTYFLQFRNLFFCCCNWTIINLSNNIFT